MADDDNDKLDIEAMQDKQEEIKKIDELSNDPDKIEEIEREFRQFLEEIVGIQNLKKFKDEYLKIHKQLRTGYDGEKKLIKRSKE